MRPSALSNTSRLYSNFFNRLSSLSKFHAASSIVKYVDKTCYRYGADAGKLTENSLYSVTNVAITANTMNNLGPKAIARRVAKDTGKAVVTVPKEDEKSVAGKDAKCVTSGHCKSGTDGPSTSSHSEGGASVHYSSRNRDAQVQYHKEASM